MSGFGPLVLSFEVATAGLLLAALIGIPLAGSMASSRGRWPDVVEGIVTVPMVLPPTVLGYYLLVALGRNSPLGSAFEAATGSPLVFSRSGAVVATFFGALPLVVKATRAAMEEIDPRVVGAARTLGASPVRVFVSIVVPLSRGGTNDWTNVITACSPCNTRKGNRLPEEIGMHPLTHPVEPHFVHLTWAVRRLTPIQARYIRTFYGDQVLHQLEALEHRHEPKHHGRNH